MNGYANEYVSDRVNQWMSNPMNELISNAKDKYIAKRATQRTIQSDDSN